MFRKNIEYSPSSAMIYNVISFTLLVIAGRNCGMVSLPWLRSGRIPRTRSLLYCWSQRPASAWRPAPASHVGAPQPRLQAVPAEVPGRRAAQLLPRTVQADPELPAGADKRVHLPGSITGSEDALQEKTTLDEQGQRCVAGLVLGL